MIGAITILQTSVIQTQATENKSETRTQKRFIFGAAEMHICDTAQAPAGIQLTGIPRLQDVQRLASCSLLLSDLEIDLHLDRKTAMPVHTNYHGAQEQPIQVIDSQDGIPLFQPRGCHTRHFRGSGWAGLRGCGLRLARLYWRHFSVSTSYEQWEKTPAIIQLLAFCCSESFGRDQRMPLQLLSFVCFAMGRVLHDFSGAPTTSSGVAPHDLGKRVHALQTRSERVTSAEVLSSSTSRPVHPPPKVQRLPMPSEHMSIGNPDSQPNPLTDTIKQTNKQAVKASCICFPVVGALAIRGNLLRGTHFR